MQTQKQRNAFSQIKLLIEAGELKLAIDQLINLLRGLESEFYNEAILQMSRLARLQKEKRMGLISGSSAAEQHNQIAYAVLQLLDAIPIEIRKQPSSDGSPISGFIAPEDARLEKIFGTNHLKNISWLQRGIEVSRSVCRLVTPLPRGTGFLVAGSWLLTNHHVIPDAGAAAASWAEFGYEEDQHRRLKPSYRYQLNVSTMQVDTALDLCLVKVEENDGNPPLSAWGSLELAPSSASKPGDHVTIIQHPQGGPKQIALTANQVVNVYDYRLQYSTDTLPGSSGAPVFNDDWKVVAIHQAGGELLSNSRGDKVFANQGILMSSVCSRFPSLVKDH